MAVIVNRSLEAVAEYYKWHCVW